MTVAPFEPGRRAGPPAARATAARLRAVVIVEDNADDEVMIVETLRGTHLAHPVQVARDGEAALALIFAEGVQAHPPAMVLLDLALVRTPGLAVLERLRADPRTRTVPVVVYTASRDPRDVTACYHAGANSYVLKPDTYAEFRARIAHVLKYWLTQNEAPAA